MSERPNSKADSRKQRYKVGVDIGEARHKRQENIVDIRKSKRAENLLKKRREGVSSAANSQPSIGDDQITSLDETKLSAAVFALASDDIKAKEAAVVYIRNLLSIESNTPIDAVIHSGAIPLLVDILRGDVPELQFEAAWALTNIASGTSEHTKVVIDHGALPILVELLSSAHDSVREQVVWALGNIVGDSPAYADLALAHGALLQLLAQFNGDAKISFLRNATWTLSNFCRGKPQPPFDQIKNVFPVLRWLIHIQDHDVLTCACWALACLTDGSTLNVQAVIDADICPKLVELLSYQSSYVVIPALETIGNIVTGDDVQTQVVIESQALPSILHLLTNTGTKKTIVKEACWIISNITAGAKEQIQAVINAQIFPPLLFLLANAEFSIKKEAAWAVSNATSSGSDEQIKYVVNHGCIQPLCDLLECSDPSTITVCLECLENILRLGEAYKIAGITDINVYVCLIEDADGLDKIEGLLSHQNTEVYETALMILENYFAEEDDYVFQRS
eukprot:PITA_04943